MKFQTFVYQDLKGKITNRNVLVIQEASDKMTAVDVSGVDDETVAGFAVAYEAARTAFLAQVAALEAQYDLRFRLRQFFPDSMQNVEVDEV
jgi:hypothetical protein